MSKLIHLPVYAFCKYTTILRYPSPDITSIIQRLVFFGYFSNLIQSYLEILQKPTDIIAQDEVCKKVVSNLYVKNNFVSVINLNPPYNSMVDLTKISTGWG